MRRCIAINCNLFRRSVFANRLNEKPPGRFNVSLLAQHKIYSVTLLINSATKILPLSSHADISLIHPPGIAYWASAAAPLLVELRIVVLNPSQDRGMRQINAALSHHLAQIPIAEFVDDVPTDTKTDN